jgi:hypothetical protein
MMHQVICNGKPRKHRWLRIDGSVKIARLKDLQTVRIQATAQPDRAAIKQDREADASLIQQAEKRDMWIIRIVAGNAQ